MGISSKNLIPYKIMYTLNNTVLFALFLYREKDHENIYYLIYIAIRKFLDTRYNKRKVSIIEILVANSQNRNKTIFF